MKRYVCTVATGLLLALMSTGTATATGLPLSVPTDQTGTQEVDFGDQTVGEQKNDADVTQAQGNGNLNIAPATGLFGDAETTNAQGNGNTATADIDQSNSVDQSQSSSQTQSLDQSGGSSSCCGGQSQTGEQKVYGGDQSVGEQKNYADVDQYQGNGNVNVSPAVSVFGDAESRNYQGNHNRADADVTQSNSVAQSQSATQKQYLTQDGADCCKPTHGSPKAHGPKENHSCCDGQSQTGEQKVFFGDQAVEKQKNDADVSQKQGNFNGSFAPAMALGGHKGNSCTSKCEKSWRPSGGNAETTNKQGNWNDANAQVGQSNSVDQSQSSYQRQFLDSGKELVNC